MNTQDIIFEVIPGAGGDIGKIILNRPPNLNALNLNMCMTLHQRLTQWAKHPAIKAVILTGAGDKAFCAGGDVRAIYELMKAGRYAEAENFFQQEYAMNQALFNFPKPYISFLDGLTMGGGVGISIHGSFSVATERLIWAMPETKIGFFPDVGVGYHLAKLPDGAGHYLALTGERLLAGDAYTLGIVQAVIPSQKLLDLEQALIQTHFKASDFQIVTQIISESHEHPDTSLNSLSTNLVRIKQYFSTHSVDDIVQQLSQSEDAWCQATRALLAAHSPISLKVTSEHLRRCASYPFEEVMNENLLLVKHFLRGHDFTEGIRSAVIDKDRRPHWHPDHLAAVPASLVQSYFEPIFGE